MENVSPEVTFPCFSSIVYCVHFKSSKEKCEKNTTEGKERNLSKSKTYKVSLLCCPVQHYDRNSNLATFRTQLSLDTSVKVSKDSLTSGMSWFI